MSHKISRELEQQILATPGITVRHAGSIQEQAEPVAREPKRLVEPDVMMLVLNYNDETETLVAFIPVKTTSEINGRDWKARSRRSGEAWKAVSRTFGPHLSMLAPFGVAYARNEALRVVFTRLGGRRMDRSNIPTATKAVEDAVAFMLGADDGDPRWHSSYEQESGDECGVRVDVSIYA